MAISDAMPTRRTRDRGAMGEKRLDEHDSRGRKHSSRNERIVAVGA
jgi:hypothetical protein